MSPLRFSRLRGALAVAAAGALALTLTACGGSAGSASSTSAAATSAASAASAASSAASGSAQASGSTQASGSAGATTGYPVTITHAFGQTVIDSAPQRVATWGWGSTDAVLALGVVPVAMPSFASFGGNTEGVMPWAADKLTELGAATPTILPNEGTDAPIEQILATKPDVLLAQYSGLTQLEYDRLTQGGVKVVTYPQTAWSTPWRDVITTTGEVLGKSAETAALLENIDATVAERAAANPEFGGKTIATAAILGGTFYVYLPADPRVQFTEDLGFTSADSVTALDTKEDTFYFTLSAEQFGSLTADVLLIYAATDEEIDTFLATPEAKLLPQVDGGKIVRVTGEAEVASVSPPTALSLTWGVDSFVDDIKTGLAA